MEAVPDRTKEPRLQPLYIKNIPQPEVITLKNGIKTHIIDAGDRDVLKVDLLFKAGRWYEPKKLIAGLTSRMLREGTHELSSEQLANKVDFFGATLKTHTTYDNGSVALFCLNKHFPNLIPVVKNILANASFPERELKNILENNRQKLLIKNKKVENIGQKLFLRHLFGEHHPYGFQPEPEDYTNISSEELRSFYDICHVSNNCKIIISGKVTDAVLNEIEKHLGGNDWSSDKPLTPNTEAPLPSGEKKVHQPKDKAVQSAIRIGYRMFNKLHPDYRGMLVVNTILGGYFGSRLMSNIREDKGFTYGIHSGIASFRHDGYFYVSTEVGTDVRKRAVDEIYLEMKRLRDEPVPDEELRIVKNYLLGTIINSLDGPFNQSKTVKGLVSYDLDNQYLYSLIEKINTIDQKEIMELANRYLDDSKMYEITVG